MYSVNNKNINIRTITAFYCQGGSHSEIEHTKHFIVLEGREKLWRKKGKIQTNQAEKKPHSWKT